MNIMRQRKNSPGREQLILERKNLEKIFLEILKPNFVRAFIIQTCFICEAAYAGVYMYICLHMCACTHRSNKISQLCRHAPPLTGRVSTSVIPLHQEQ